MTDIDMKAAALELALGGTPVFPCNPNTKRPLSENGFKDATTDLATIVKWWEKTPSAMIAVPTGKASGFWVLDIDDPETFRANCAIDLPDTRQVKTGRGLHFYWRFGDDEVRNSQKNQKNGKSVWPFPDLPGADVRGEGGYVIVPPSLHPNGARYEILNDAAIAEAPAELLRIATKQRRGSEKDVPLLPMELKSPLWEARDTNYGLSALDGEIASIRSAPNGTQEHTLNTSALKMGSLVAGGELSMDTARKQLIAAGTLMVSHNQHDPWTIVNVSKKVERGLTDGANQPRSANTVTQPNSTFLIGQKSAQSRDQTDVYQTLNLTDLDNMPPMEWRIKNLVPKQGLVFIYGKPGHHKTFVTIDMALRCAYGLDWHGRRAERCGVLYICGEGQFGVAQRIKGWRKKHGLEGADAPIKLLPVAVHLLNPDCLGKLKHTIDKVRQEVDFEIGLVVVDTVSRSIPGKDENSQDTMSLFIDACADIQSHCGGTVIGVHHSGKDNERGMRGSSVLLGGCDTAICITKVDEHTTLSVEKQKDGDQIDSVHFKMEGIDLTSGLETVSTLVPILSCGKTLIAEKDLNWDQIREIFGSIDIAFNASQAWSNYPQSKRSGRYAPAIIAHRFGVTEKLASGYITQWMLNGYLEVAEAQYKGKTKGLRVIRYLEPKG